MKKKRDLVEVTKREVIRVKAKKYDVCSLPEMKKFSIDPELTNFQMLRDILKTAFDIKCDFIISYMVPGSRGSEDRYLPMLSEWDLNTAIYGASDPVLTLKIDLKAGLDEWDIIEQEDLQSCLFDDPTTTSSASSNYRSATATTNDLSNVNERTLTASVGNLLHKSWFGTNNGLKNGQYTNAGNWMEKGKTGSPLTESLFRSYFDAEGRMLRPDSFRLAIYQGGMDAALRPIVWKFLLNVYPPSSTDDERRQLMSNLTEKYYLLRDTVLRKFKTGRIGEELRLVANAVRKDVIRTDRTHPFFAGNEDENKNLMALFNLLTTYALTHPEVSYCQGMSDLASPLLVVMQNEAEAYICFCSLMRRMRRNFSCDGRSMTKKFCHLSELLQHYDPSFYDYLREMHADDLLFCYRWLLLELKREFSFENALLLTEVMWASLPTVENCSTVEMFDVDITASEDDFAEPSPFCADLDNAEGDGSFRQSHLDGNTLFGYVMELDSTSEDDDDDDAFNQRHCQRLRPVSVSSTRSCPVNMAEKAYGVCPAAVVRSLMLHESENARLHALRHASYPPKKSAQTRMRRKNIQPRFTIGSGPDAELSKELAELTSIKEVCNGKSCSLTTSRSAESLTDSNGLVNDASLPLPQENEIPVIQKRSVVEDKPNEQRAFAVRSTTKDDLHVVKRASRAKDKDSKRRYTMDEKAIRSKKPTYNIRPSTEMAVADEESPQFSQKGNVREQSPVPVARDASVEVLMSGDDDDRHLTLTEIHDLCLMQSTATCPPSSSASSAEDIDSGQANTTGADLRSRQPSGGGGGVASTVATTSCLTAATVVGNSSAPCGKSRHASSSGGNGGCATTNFDSGFSDASNNTAPCGVSSIDDGTSRAGDSNAENLFADVLEYANDRDTGVRASLPPPNEFGDGNPFMLFVCLTLLLQHRDAITKKRMDFNEIAIHFDKLMKKHNVRKVLKRARVLFADYLKGFHSDGRTVNGEVEAII